MSVTEKQSSGFLDKMKQRAANRPAAPLAQVTPEELIASTVAASPAEVPAPLKKPVSISERTMSFKLAEPDYDAVDEVIFKRKRAGEKGLTNKEAGREMVALWLEKHGIKPFDYGTR